MSTNTKKTIAIDDFSKQTRYTRSGCGSHLVIDTYRLQYLKSDMWSTPTAQRMEPLRLNVTDFFLTLVDNVMLSHQ